MNDLISRQAAIKAIVDLPNNYNGFSDTFDKAQIVGVLEELPPVQPERKKANWNRKENAVAIYYNCSSCRGALNWRGRFCPYCGAEMENRAG